MTHYDRIKLLINSYKQGELTLDELKTKVQPIIEEMNQKNREIAKKYNLKPKLVNLNAIMRNTY